MSNERFEPRDPQSAAAERRRVGAYRMEGAGQVLQMLPLGEHLLSLHSGGLLAVWRVGQYDAPEVRAHLPCDLLLWKHNWDGLQSQIALRPCPLTSSRQRQRK